MRSTPNKIGNYKLGLEISSFILLQSVLNRRGAAILALGLQNNRVFYLAAN